jgi:4'-phosphopantetheinyl transferase EntD
MISYAWRYNSDDHITGCGVDAEQIDRFRKYESVAECPLPFVFTPMEYRNALSNGPLFAAALCLCFTCKEALFKALQTPFDYTLCELLPKLTSETSRYDDVIALDDHLKRTLNISHARVHALLRAVSGEIVSSVVTFGAEGR